MSPRRRTQGTEHFPAHLSKIKHKGKNRFQFRCIDGSRKLFPAGTTEHQAIQAAIAYNAKHRGHADMFNLETTPAPRKKDKFDKPLSEWLKVVIARVENEESLSGETLSTFKLDCERLVKSLGYRNTKSITLQDLNSWLSEHFADKSKNVYNRKVSFLKKVFAYLADESAVTTNVAEQKKQRKMTKADKKKNRLDLSADDYKRIHAAAPLFLKTAMEIALQSTHAVKELHRIKYSITAPTPGVCGIVWNDGPKHENGMTIYGTLYIHRHKVQNNKAAFVAIPVTQSIKDTVDRSRLDKLVCPYVVHRKNKLTNGLAKECDHRFQCTSKIISRAFSGVRDELGLYADIPKEERPTFHEIRRLAARLISGMGENPQKRMAHANEATTKIYTDNNDVEWHQVSPIMVAI